MPVRHPSGSTCGQPQRDVFDLCTVALVTAHRGLVSTGNPTVPAEDDTLYLPLRAGAEPAPGTVSIDVSADADGVLTGAAFTSPEALVAAYGPDAPWVSMTARTVGEQFLAAGITTVVLDPVPAPGEDEAEAGA